jgi:hydrogenase/urease accessory protein HupE
VCFAPLSLLYAASPAFAHTVGQVGEGWSAGFNHPLHGWDHLLVMVAVGLWAAQQSGRARWLVPLTFVGTMAAGGVAGASGIAMPGFEAAILLSVVVFAGLVIARVRMATGYGLAVVALFAFFHGFAHGQEMPGSAGLVTFGFGFLVATVLLHGLGFATACGAMALAAMGMTATAYAESASSNAGGDGNGERMPEIVVYGRQDSLLGLADSATQGTVGADQLARRPMTRSGEVLETVPGVIITQHAGGGKANQYFMRGFNLDHGTDFATSLDDMPLNLRSHGHGQGYSDMNIVIPELIRRVNYEKGVYDAANGDFSSAGAAHLETFKTLPKDLAVFEGGMYGYGRGVGAVSFGAGPGNILVGAEIAHSDGPWVRGDDFWKENGQITYSQGDSGQGFSATVRGYHGRWNSSDQVAESAVATGLVPFFSSLDNTTGGHSQRYSLQGEWHRSRGGSSTRISAYGFYYDLGLLSDFTYFLTDPVHGDQFQQKDMRWTSGLDARHTLFNDLLGRPAETTVGFQFRNDQINNGLFNTQDGVRVDKIDGDDGSLIPATARRDSISESSYGFYIKNKTRWTGWFRSDLGVRGDIFTFDVRSTLAQNSGRRSDSIVSPKLSLIFGPWAKTELYLQAGEGFHSNDARGVLTRVDPVTGRGVDADGNAIAPADPLVRTKGAEVGVRTVAVPGFQSTLSVWMLDVKSELLFVGDAGTTEPSRPSRRYGVEFANFYTPFPWLTLDADVAWSHARYRDAAPDGDHIPGSIETVISAGITLQNERGLFGGLRLRYFGPRPLIEDNSFRSKETLLVNARLGYTVSETWSIYADVLNLLNRRDHDIDYAYESRITPTAGPMEEIHFHPVEPRQVRITLKTRF